MSFVKKTSAVSRVSYNIYDDSISGSDNLSHGLVVAEHVVSDSPGTSDRYFVMGTELTRSQALDLSRWLQESKRNL